MQQPIKHNRGEEALRVVRCLRFFTVFALGANTYKDYYTNNSNHGLVSLSNLKLKQ